MELPPLRINIHTLHRWIICHITVKQEQTINNENALSWKNIVSAVGSSNWNKSVDCSNFSLTNDGSLSDFASSSGHLITAGNKSVTLVQTVSLWGSVLPNVYLVFPISQVAGDSGCDFVSTLISQRNEHFLQSETNYRPGIYGATIFSFGFGEIRSRK